MLVILDIIETVKIKLVITHDAAYLENLSSSFLPDSCVIAMRTIVFYDQSFSSRDIMVTVGNVFAATESAAYSIRGFDHYPRRNTQMARTSVYHNTQQIISDTDNGFLPRPLP